MIDTPTEEEMHDPNTWDFDRATTVKLSKPPGAVVSIRFTRDDLSIVANAAQQNDMKTSEFIRAAAIEKASVASRKAVVRVSPSAGQNVKTAPPTNWQRTFGTGRVRVVSRILSGWGLSSNDA